MAAHEDYNNSVFIILSPDSGLPSDTQPKETVQFNGAIQLMTGYLESYFAMSTYFIELLSMRINFFKKNEAF